MESRAETEMSKIHIKMGNLSDYSMWLSLPTDHYRQQIQEVDNFTVHCCLFFCPNIRLTFKKKKLKIDGENIVRIM